MECLLMVNHRLDKLLSFKNCCEGRLRSNSTWNFEHDWRNLVVLFTSHCRRDDASYFLHELRKMHLKVEISITFSPFPRFKLYFLKILLYLHLSPLLLPISQLLQFSSTIYLTMFESFMLLFSFTSHFTRFSVSLFYFYSSHVPLFLFSFKTLFHSFSFLFFLSFLFDLLHSPSKYLSFFLTNPFTLPISLFFHISCCFFSNFIPSLLYLYTLSQFLYFFLIFLIFYFSHFILLHVCFFLFFT